MKTKRQELIDFVNWQISGHIPYAGMFIDKSVDEYLKSINSEASDETPNVNNNEQKKRICYYRGEVAIYCYDDSKDCSECTYT